jgi:hypothetical protein
MRPCGRARDRNLGLGSAWVEVHAIRELVAGRETQPWRLSLKPTARAIRVFSACATATPPVRWVVFRSGRPGRLGGGQGCFELQEVVGGGDQVDLALNSRSAASEDTGDPADVFPVSEDRLDELLSLPVGLFARLGR